MTKHRKPLKHTPAPFVHLYAAVHVLYRTDLVDDVHEVGGVREVTVVELQAHGRLVAVPVDVVDALGVEA